MTGSGPTDAPLLAGRYAIGDPIGRGRSTVHRATDTRLRRQVAIKEVRLAEAQEAVEQVRLRATREAQAAARLNNPGVVTVYDVVEEGGSIWLVMELVEAPSLAQIVGDEGPLTHPRAARIGQGVVSALQAAHAVGIVHRDVKPANVLVMIGDRTKLADFGVATIRDESRVTATGTIVGSPSYMAPEQAMAADVGPFTDLWALGATLYFAVEGVPPFVGDSPLATASAVVHGDPRTPKNRGPLTSLLMRLLDKDAARRPTARQVRVTLSAIAGPSAERRDDTLVARSPLARSPSARGAGARGAGGDAAGRPAPASPSPRSRRDPRRIVIPGARKKAKAASPTPPRPQPAAPVAPAAPAARADEPPSDITYAAPLAGAGGPGATPAAGSAAPPEAPTTPAGAPAGRPSAAPPEPPGTPGEVATAPAGGPSGTSATDPAGPAEALAPGPAPAADLAEATALPETPAADPPVDTDAGAPAGTAAEDDPDGPATTTAPPAAPAGTAAPAGASDPSPPGGSGAATTDPVHGGNAPPAGPAPDALPSAPAASSAAAGAPDRDESPPRVAATLAGSGAAAGSGPADEAAAVEGAPAGGTADDEPRTRTNDDDAVADASRHVAGAPAAGPPTDAAADTARTDTAVAGTAAVGASGDDSEGGPGAAAAQRVAALGTDARRRWAALGPQRQRVVVAVAVLVLLAVTIWALAGGGGGDGGGTETGDGSSGTTATTATTTETGEASTEAPAGGEGDATTTTAADEQGGDVPDGWTAYQDPTAGYTIAHPAGWRVEPADGPRIDIRDPATGSYLRIDWTDEPRPDPVADWRTQSERFASGHEAYREIRIEPYEYRDYNAAVWEFTYREGGADLHVANLGFVAGPRGYALYFQTPEDQWSASQDTFASFRETFQPSS